jgi:hypothetical protein
MIFLGKRLILKNIGFIFIEKGKIITWGPFCQAGPGIIAALVSPKQLVPGKYQGMKAF